MARKQFGISADWKWIVATLIAACSCLFGFLSLFGPFRDDFFPRPTTTAVVAVPPSPAAPTPERRPASPETEGARTPSGTQIGPTLGAPAPAAPSPATNFPTSSGCIYPLRPDQVPPTPVSSKTEPFVVIEGRLLYTSGNPVANVRVETDKAGEVMTDSLGAFAIEVHSRPGVRLLVFMGGEAFTFVVDATSSRRIVLCLPV